jgi:hypothetical protein
MIEPIRVAVGVVLLVLAFGAGWLAAPRPHPLPPPACVAEAVAPAAPEKVQITLISEPPGASVAFANGLPGGRTPFSFDLDRSDEQFDARITLPGYLSEIRTIRPDLNRTILLDLRHKAHGGDFGVLLAPRF